MSFTLARLKSNRVPRTRSRPYASGSTFAMGALLVLNGSDEWAECGADPASIGAISQHAVGADTLGYGGHGFKEFPPGYALGMLVQDEVAYMATYVGSLPAANGGSYGVVKDATLGWSVDFTDTTATRVKLVGRRTTSPENIALVEVVFLTANIQVL